MKAIAIALLAGALVSGSQGLSLNGYTVTITWDSDDPCKVAEVAHEPTNCLYKESQICVARTDFIIWQSINPPNAKYEIYFDPIMGQPLKSGGNGKIVRQIDDNAPLAEYKYSILRDGCPANEENTFDPRIRVDH